MGKLHHGQINNRLTEHINKHDNGKSWAVWLWANKTWLYISSSVNKQEAKMVVEYPDNWDFITCESRRYYKIIMNTKR